MMKLSTKGRHAITAMMELALRQHRGPVTLADISVEQAISVSYLEQLFARLRKSGLVTGLRGPGGGYCLRRPAKDISIAEILAAVDDAVQSPGAATDPSQVTGEIPESVSLWRQLSNRIYGYLDSITLADAVVDRAWEAEQERKLRLDSAGQRSAA
ncbi:MAG TPA: Rrf2 family transcriptional regulator [Gammaproteobacteria bacterium]|nr:Rrf2 family transcriptional regulator [Gammaproteobacteria bacterium]